MYFDHPAGGAHPPERNEAHIHAVYRKLFTLVKSMTSPDDISRALIHMLQGLFGADGAVLCHVYDDGARFVSANGSLSHMENAEFDMSAPFARDFLRDKKALFKSRNECSQELLSICLNAQFESLLLVPIAINGQPYGLFGLVSNQPGYFEQRDADTIYEISRFLALLLEARAHDLMQYGVRHYGLLGGICHQLAPGLHSATVDLIQAFSQIRRSYADQKYNLIAEPLKASVAGIENMAKRIQDLKMLGDICSATPAEMSSIQLADVMDNVVSYNRSQIDECATVRCIYEDHIPVVRGDFTMIWQALHEVLQNAMRAVSLARGDEHEISVRAYGLPSVAVVEISDTGNGIEPADAPHIFEPLFSRWPHCRGLGLTRAQVNVLQMHGSILYHPAQNGGATFRLAFPDENYVPQTEVF